MALRLSKVRIDTGSPDEEGRLVFADGRLIAVLVRLSEQHEDLAGQWFIEAKFGKLDGRSAPIFADLPQAQAWIEQRLRQSG
jgi:hypothetical protein